MKDATACSATRLSSAQLTTVRRASVWGYSPVEICEMFPYATVEMVEDIQTSFNPKLRQRFHITQPQQVVMVHQMKKEGLTVHQIANQLHVSVVTIRRYLATVPAINLQRDMRHYSEILKSLHGDRPYNVASPIFKKKARPRSSGETACRQRNEAKKKKGLNIFRTELSRQSLPERQVYTNLSN